MANFSGHYPPTSRITSVTFMVLTDYYAQKHASSNISNSKHSSDEIGGLFDPHLGSLSDSKPCFSCYNTKKLCEGHSGVLPLKHPYIIPQFEPYVKTILRKICLTCYRIVGTGKKCPSCRIEAPVLKDLKGMKTTLMHNGKKYVLDPKEIKNILNNIDLKTAIRDLNIGICPADLISNNLFISSPVIRPDKRVESEFKNNDEFTISLISLVSQGVKLNQMNENSLMFEKLYESMCEHMTSYHKGDNDSKDDPSKGGQTKSIPSSMASKEGRVRGNILGKKSSNIGRAVIACDSSNPPDVVTIPIEFAMSVFAKEVVRDFNRERLQQVFHNGPNEYPGATYILKSDGKRYQIGNANVRMEEGDTIFRHLETGDYVLLNREPSLLPASICTHKIRVATEPGTDTMDLNVIACPLYNADFDGDEMNIIIVTTESSLAEAEYVSTIHNRIISMKDNNLAISEVQDSVIGGYLITRDKYRFDQMFNIRIHQNVRIKMDMNKFGKSLTGKEVLSLVLPQINYRGKSSFYVPEYEEYIKYNPEDKALKIELGEIKEGFFDNNAEHFEKEIALTNDPKTALDFIFSIEEAVLNFNKYHGFSVGIKDFYVSPKNRLMIEQKKDELMTEAYSIILNYAKNNIVMNPLEESKYGYLIDMLSNAFADDCVKELMHIPEVEGNEVKNNLYNLALSGSKGKFSNLKSMLAMVGFVLTDNEPLKHDFEGRMNMFFKRFDLDPRSYGVILNSYLSGLTPCELLFNSIPERIEMLQKVLSVAKAGSMGRKLIKNYESLIVYNTRFVRKLFGITHLLFGYDGFEVETLSKYQIPNVKDAEETFLQKFLETCPIETARSKCEDHAKYVSKIVQVYKTIMLNNQRINDQYEFTDEIYVPLVIESLLSTRIYQLSNKVPKEEYLLHNIKKLRNFLDDLGYIYFNHNLRQEHKFIPQMYHNATLFIKIALSTCFTLDKLALFNAQQFDMMLADIHLYLEENLVEYGTPIGINTAQCFEEFLTQTLLDSIHKTGSGRVKKTSIDRLSEIFANKDPMSQKTPPVIRIPLNFGVNRERADFIANRIKLIEFSSLIESWSMLFTDLENLDKEDARNRSDLDFLGHQKLPENITKWCLRVELDKMKLFINSISMQEIKESLLSQFDVHLISNTEDEPRPVIRIYLGSTITFESRSELREHAEKMLTCTVRGIKTIISAVAVPENISVMDPKTKEIEQKSRFCIVAEGSNLKDIFKLETVYGNDIEFENITCDSIVLTYEWFGRTATMIKIVNEIKATIKDKVNIRHIYLLADEMLQTGKLTTIETEGVKERNPHNDLLEISESRPIITIRKAALQNKKSYVESLSANMMVGQTPDAGTNFNEILINEKILMNESRTASNYSDLISEFV